MLIDTHCHLHDREFFTAEQAEEMLKRANDAGVKRVICIGTSHKDSVEAEKFAKEHSGVYWTYGVHPDGAKEYTQSSSIRISDSHPIAIGEVGLDYHFDGYDREAQIRLFEQMLQLAIDNNLPVSFHVREAFEDFFAVVANFPSVRGVVHSFSDSKKKLKRILETTDFYIGVNGLATYSTLPLPPLERILLETDAPFLTPVPFRGIINEPAYVPCIADWLSQKMGVGLETIEKETTRNAEKLFNFSDTSL